MRDRKIIRDAGAFQLLADETRMKIIYLLRAKEMTVSQISGELALTPQTIYHHIRKMRKAEMVEVSREERIENVVESYYRATAGYFHFVNGSCASECGGMEWLHEILKGLGNLDLKVDLSDKEASRILRLGEGIMRQRQDPNVVGKIYDMDDIDPSVGDVLAEYAMMMNMNDQEFGEYLEALSTLRERLLSGKVEKR